MPFVIAAAGPKGIAAARELGDGVFGAPMPIPGFDWSIALTFGTVLAEGEDRRDGPRVLAAAGHAAPVLFHFALENDRLDMLPNGEAWAAAYADVPPRARHLALQNRETVEYQRPRSKRRFLEVYEEEGVEQLLFEVAQSQEIVGYAECAFEITGTDNWMNERYFAKHDMRPLFVEELAVHPSYQGRGIGGFVLEQLEHLARVRGCTHLVLEVAENNKRALSFYRARATSPARRRDRR